MRSLHKLNLFNQADDAQGDKAFRQIFTKGSKMKRLFILGFAFTFSFGCTNSEDHNSLTLSSTKTPGPVNKSVAASAKLMAAAFPPGTVYSTPMIVWQGSALGCGFYGTFEQARAGFISCILSDPNVISASVALEYFNGRDNRAGGGPVLRWTYRGEDGSSNPAVTIVSNFAGGVCRD